jgi:flagellar motor switch protein FliG
MLCLCGLPNPVAEAALAMLPKGQAKTVREQINGLSALNLRDIDNAKESVAQASMMFTDKSQRAMAA